MVRAPCCEKMGLKKGPWTPEEDQILISHIEKYGHGNWRALPKQAGLLRCGKSCRLRWTNYLRPDIKRGNFTKDEEESIIKLHQMMGNRWSAIAAKLPGRTDNEIKNVWHTHLKKRLLRQQNQDTPNAKSITKPRCKNPTSAKKSQPIDPNFPIYPGSDGSSPQQSFSDFSSVTESSFISGEAENSIKDEEMDFESFPLIDESFWSDSSSAENSSMISELSTETEIQFSSGSLVDANGSIYGFSSMNEDDDLNFWYNIFVGVGDLIELPEF